GDQPKRNQDVLIGQSTHLRVACSAQLPVSIEFCRIKVLYGGVARYRSGVVLSARHHSEADDFVYGHRLAKRFAVGADRASSKDCLFGSDWTGICAVNIDSDDVPAADDLDLNMSSQRRLGSVLNHGGHAMWVGAISMAVPCADHGAIVIHSDEESS